jgi:hypothetical protein
MRTLLLLLFILSFNNIIAQTSEEDDKKAILAVLKAQRLAWSDDNMEEFMEGYWKSDSLKFYGKNGVVQGWGTVFEKYNREFPDKNHTGTLSFKINDISKISEGAYFVLGEYHIKRNVGNADGFFMVIFKKINDVWKIIADTSV